MGAIRRYAMNSSNTVPKKDKAVHRPQLERKLTIELRFWFLGGIFMVLTTLRWLTHDGPVGSAADDARRIERKVLWQNDTCPSNSTIF